MSACQRKDIFNQLVQPKADGRLQSIVVLIKDKFDKLVSPLLLNEYQLINSIYWVAFRDLQFDYSAKILITYIYM